MISQEKISSGYDVELLMGEEYLRHVFMTLFETGSMPWWTEKEATDDNGNHLRTDATVLHPPEILNAKRLYDVHPDFIGHEHPFIDLIGQVYSFQEDELQVTILKDHPLGATIRVKAYPSIITNTDDPAKIAALLVNAVDIDLDIKAGIIHDAPNERGLINNIRLNIELVDIGGPLVDAALLLRDDDGNPLYTKEGLMSDLKETIDREFPFSVSGGGALQKIDMKLFVDEADAPNAIGVYINLALQTGPAPGEYVDDRGNLDDAQNFLPMGSQMAFGIANDTFPRLAKDLFHKMAQLKKDSETEYYYPFKDGDEELGVIKGVSIFAEQDMNGFTNTLVISVHGEYQIDYFPDPDFKLNIKLKPVNKDGVMDFDVTYDVSLSPLAEILTLLLEIGIAVVAPALGITLFVLTGAGIAIAEHVLADKAAEKIEGEGNITSFLDTLPHKLVVEQRSWDPVYFTLHQLQITGDNMVVNNKGLAFSAGNIFIGRRFEPSTDAVIRDVSRDGDAVIDGLHYRATKFNELKDTDLIAIFPAVDRMPYTDALPPSLPLHPHYRILLTFDQIAERMELRKVPRIIPYQPQKIHVVDHQIFKLFALSVVEIAEISSSVRRSLKDHFRALNAATHRTEAIAALTDELGRTPTEEEINDRVEELLDADVELEFPAQFIISADARMSLELEPSEFAGLQQKETLELNPGQLEIITRRDGEKETVYYRDIRYKPKPEPDSSDNLLDLRKY